MITGRDFVIISSIAWDFLWQGQQDLASRLARAGNRVLFIDGSGIRAPELRDSRRVGRYVARWLSGIGKLGVRTVAENVWACTPVVLPPFGPRWRREVNRRILLPRLRRAADSLGFSDPIIISYLPTDTALSTIELLATPRSVVVAYCVADFSFFATEKEALRQSEEALLRRADVVFVQEPILEARCRLFNENIHTIPHGLNLDPFLAPVSENSRASSDLFGIAPPIIGYIGGLHSAIDWDVLREAVSLRPQWNWVFVGPMQVEPSLLPRGPNVLYVGTREHAELPAYVARFDTCIIPYRVEPGTEVVMPTKLNEYLAAGKPVVSTRIPVVVAYQREHDEVVLSESSPDAFVAAIERSLAEPMTEEVAKRRREIAALHDWNVRIREISEALQPIVDRDCAPAPVAALGR